MVRRSLSTLALAAGLALGGTAAHADLTPAGIYTGNVGLSVDASGTNAAAGSIQASVPIGATILQAFLYAAGTPFPFYANSPTTLATYNALGITLAGNTISTFDKLVGATSTRADIGAWYTARADVTSLVTSLVAGAVSPNFSFAVTEGGLTNRIDGLVLAIVYQQAGLPLGSVALLDGGQNTGGETTTVTLANPLGDTTSPSFQASLGLGISFSINGQASSVDVNGSRLTNFAGDNDDSTEAADGALITAGGVGDNAGNNVGSYADDDELYDLKPFLKTGDTGFTIFTSNPTADDNIFVASLYVTGQIGSVTPGPVNPIPEPETYALMLAGLGLLGAAAKRRKAKRAA